MRQTLDDNNNYRMKIFKERVSDSITYRTPFFIGYQAFIKSILCTNFIFLSVICSLASMAPAPPR